MAVTKNNQFSKTKLCVYFQKGQCKKSAKDCHFAHTESEVRPLPNLSNTKLCSAIVHGRECTNPECQYAHDASSLKMAEFSDTHKTSMCFFFKKGKCMNGDKCRFAHSMVDLRAPSKSKQSSLSFPIPPPPPPPPLLAKTEGGAGKCDAESWRLDCLPPSCHTEDSSSSTNTTASNMNFSATLNDVIFANTCMTCDSGMGNNTSDPRKCNDVQREEDNDRPNDGTENFRPKSLLATSSTTRNNNTTSSNNKLVLPLMKRSGSLPRVSFPESSSTVSTPLSRLTPPHPSPFSSVDFPTILLSAPPRLDDGSPPSPQVLLPPSSGRVDEGGVGRVDFCRRFSWADYCASLDSDEGDTSISNGSAIGAGTGGEMSTTVMQKGMQQIQRLIVEGIHRKGHSKCPAGPSKGEGGNANDNNSRITSSGGVGNGRGSRKNRRKSLGGKKEAVKGCQQHVIRSTSNSFPSSASNPHINGRTSTAAVASGASRVGVITDDVRVCQSAGAANNISDMYHTANSSLGSLPDEKMCYVVDNKSSSTWSADYCATINNINHTINNISNISNTITSIQNNMNTLHNINDISSTTKDNLDLHMRRDLNSSSPVKGNCLEPFPCSPSPTAPSSPLHLLLSPGSVTPLGYYTDDDNFFSSCYKYYADKLMQMSPSSSPTPLPLSDGSRSEVQWECKADATTLAPPLVAPSFGGACIGGGGIMQDNRNREPVEIVSSGIASTSRREGGVGGIPRTNNIELSQLMAPPQVASLSPPSFPPSFPPSVTPPSVTPPSVTPPLLPLQYSNRLGMCGDSWPSSLSSQQQLVSYLGNELRALQTLQESKEGQRLRGVNIQYQKGGNGNVVNLPIGTSVLRPQPTMISHSALSSPLRPYHQYIQPQHLPFRSTDGQNSMNMINTSNKPFFNGANSMMTMSTAAVGLPTAITQAAMLGHGGCTSYVHQQPMLPRRPILTGYASPLPTYSSSILPPPSTSAIGIGALPTELQTLPPHVAVSKMMALEGGAQLIANILANAKSTST